MISVHILTKNSQKYIREVLESLQGFSDIIVYDTGSQDHTLSIVREFENVRLYEAPFEGFGETHNKAASLAANDWILSIDSDEIVSDTLRKALLGLKPERGAVYTLSRKNIFNGKWIRYSGWNPDRPIRLYNRMDTSFSNAKVHESVQAKKMKIIHLKGDLIHYSYDKIQDFLAKMQAYSTLFAEQTVGRRQSSPLKAIMHGVFAFFKSYVLKRGFLDGREGWIIAAYNGHTAYYKYLKLWELNRQRDSSSEQKGRKTY